MSERERQEGVSQPGVCNVCHRSFPTQEELGKHVKATREGIGKELLPSVEFQVAFDEGMRGDRKSHPSYVIRHRRVEARGGNSC